MACEEAELGPDEYSERLQMQQTLHSHVRISNNIYFILFFNF